MGGTLGAPHTGHTAPLDIGTPDATPASVADRFFVPSTISFAPGFPPTLIQAGTKEILLSDAVRLHRAIADAGGDARLDLSEGRWHVFRSIPFDLPESKHAGRNVAAFLDRHLGR